MLDTTGMQITSNYNRFFFFFLFTLLAQIFFSSSSNSNSSLSSSSSYYAQCSPSTCGTSILQFPFGLNPMCRGAYITIHCNNGTVFLTADEEPRFQYKLLQNLTHDVYTNTSVKLVDVSFLGCGSIPDFTGPTTSSMKWLTLGAIYMSASSSDEYRAVTYFNCSQEPNSEILKRLTRAPCLECEGVQTNNMCYYYNGYMGQISNCRVYKVITPVKLLDNVTAMGNPRRVLQQGLTVVWEGNCNSCMEKDGGRCGYFNQDRRRGDEVCFCRDGVHKHDCTDGQMIKLDDGSYQHRQKNWILQLLMFLGIGLGGALVVASALYVYLHRRRKQRRRILNGQDEQVLNDYLKENYTTIASVETFLLNYTSGRPTRFSFKQLKKYTNNFNHKLGQGGFGSVFKGELPNGFPIAVKLIDETDHSEVQFLNEILTIGKIHHNHLVRLLGYSFEQSKQALVYEFMKNGSLNKYIHGGDDVEKLNWNQLVDIAIGTAKGIAYLHEECRIRILHCDIKPHNILLDDKFQPKVADFGLAQAMNRDKTHASFSHGAGTPGYAAPEMWWANCGSVTDKSDVYSFGMVVLEMVGKRRNFKGDVSKTSEMYFPEWVFKHHVMNACVDGSNCGSKWNECEGKEQEEMTRRMELVGLWCIQFQQSRRPSMRRVIEMLEGNLEVQIPPSPFQLAGGGFINSGSGSWIMPVLPELGNGIEEESSSAGA